MEDGIVDSMETTMTAPARYMATNLHYVMNQQGRKFTWLAAQLGVDPTGLNHIARGRRSVDAERAEAIAAVLDVELAAIFTQAAVDVAV